MKARIAITTDEGVEYEGEVELSVSGARGGAGARATRVRRAAEPAVASPHRGAVDFTLPVRAFMSRYAKGGTGHRSLALLVARLAEGQVSKEVHAGELKAEWNRLTGLLGGPYAGMYGTRAKNNAWVDSPRDGIFVLLPDWTQAIGGGSE